MKSLAEHKPKEKYYCIFLVGGGTPTNGKTLLHFFGWWQNHLPMENGKILLHFLVGGGTTYQWRTEKYYCIFWLVAESPTNGETDSNF